METIRIDWRDGYRFEAAVPSGAPFMMDSHPDHGGVGAGPTPFEALLSSAAACSAIDVLSILEKKKQKVTAYRIEVTYERGPEGVWPRPITGMKIRHIVSGDGLDENAVSRAVELSDTKYCSVVATLRTNVAVESTWAVE
ncbi:MAG: OsmC family protein [Fimbriimonadaceae bacterium]|nr:OsmC family protein [Fimbriimonadaceae bacterium]